MYMCMYVGIFRVYFLLCLKIRELSGHLTGSTNGYHHVQSFQETFFMVLRTGS